ncbi:MAG: hypothetical protein ACE5E6_00850 [Phycisphaerae bacterium]
MPPRTRDTHQPATERRRSALAHGARIVRIACAALTVGCFAARAQPPPGVPANDPSDNAAPKETRTTPLTTGLLSGLAIWDDGLCEMSYYRAVDRIYGKQRRYTRVHLLNRQWVGRASGVKTNERDADAVPVFKLNIAEEVPVENYNYRYLTTVFLVRPALAPMKMVVSSQEWCGTTFKHLRWLPDGIAVRSFSYFGDEGDRTWRRTVDALPYEGLVVVARDVAASGRPRTADVLPPMRSNRQVPPNPTACHIVVASENVVSVPAGRFTARTVDLNWSGPPTRFVVEASPPYRLIKFDMGDIHAELAHVERRAYWDPQSPSGFYKHGAAP